MQDKLLVTLSRALAPALTAVGFLAVAVSAFLVWAPGKARFVRELDLMAAGYVFIGGCILIGAGTLAMAVLSARKTG